MSEITSTKTPKIGHFLINQSLFFSIADNSNCASRIDVDDNLAALSLQVNQMPKKSPKVSFSYCSDFVAILAGSSFATSMENAFQVVAGKPKCGLLAAISR